MKAHIGLPRVVYRKLGRERASAQIMFSKDLIEVDPRQSANQELDSLIHEAIHRADPRMSEARVIKLSRIIRGILWHQGYRKVKLK